MKESRRSHLQSVMRRLKPRNSPRTASPKGGAYETNMGTEIDQQEANAAVAAAVIDENIDRIVALQTEEEHSASRHQLGIEKIVSVVAVPAFLYVIVSAIAAWIVLNMGWLHTGIKPWDPMPFALLQTCLAITSPVFTAVVLITQNRQGRLADRRAHLDLQVNLLVDRKTAKIIQLIEEMRRDSPHLVDRDDEEAQAMEVAVDPVVVASQIATKLDAMQATSTQASEADVLLDSPAAAQHAKHENDQGDHKEHVNEAPDVHDEKSK